MRFQDPIIAEELATETLVSNFCSYPITSPRI
jgi:hypothetical protein